MPEPTRPRILYVVPSNASFIRVDRELLAERYEIDELRQPGRFANPLKVLGRVRRADLVVGWWASWHTFWPFTLAKLARRPSLLIVGGFDTASMPDIDYGFQQGGLRTFMSRFVMRRATTLVTNSNYSLEEIRRNIGWGPERVTVVHHGLPDPYGKLPGDPDREPLALSVGLVTRGNLDIKGMRAFVRAAHHAPEIPFVLAGPWQDDAIDDLRTTASPNVTFTGWLEQEDLDALFARASAYVQASRHEGFGIAVAEAMLAGCIPVVTAAGALPEVVGDAGIQIATDRPEEVAEGVRRAVALGPEARAAARRRILETFPLEVRRRGLLDAVERTLRPKRG